MPMFSIIVPTHNGAGRIRKAIESVKSQTWQDYELIVICDACTDTTQNVVNDARGGDNRVNVLICDCQRDGLARNMGLNAAQGKWILFLDDDDELLHDRCLELLADNVGKNNEDVLMFSFIVTGKWYHRQTAENYYTGSCGHCWRRSFIGSERFSDAPYGSDTDFTQRQIARNPAITFWDMPLYRYNYMREGSLSWVHEHGGEHH